MNNTDIIQEEEIITPTKVDLLKVWWSIFWRSGSYGIIILISLIPLLYWKASLIFIAHNRLFSITAVGIIVFIIYTIVTKNILTKRVFENFHVRLQMPDGQAADQKESLKFAATLAAVTILTHFLIKTLSEYILIKTLPEYMIHTKMILLFVKLTGVAIDFYITVFFFTKYKKYKVVFFKNRYAFTV